MEVITDPANGDLWRDFYGCLVVEVRKVRVLKRPHITWIFLLFSGTMDNFSKERMTEIGMLKVKNVKF